MGPVWAGVEPDRFVELINFTIPPLDWKRSNAFLRHYTFLALNKAINQKEAFADALPPELSFLREWDSNPRPSD